MKIVATTSLPAVDRPNADRWNAARLRQNTVNTCLVTLYGDACCEEDTNSQGDMAQALEHVVHPHGVDAVDLQGYGAHAEAAEEEHQVS